MPKLLRRLGDAAKSGVYGARHERDILDALQGSKLSVARINLAGAKGKEALLARIASALEFPPWFGANWDALEDCLTDLSWHKADGHVLIFEDADASDDLGILIDVLGSAGAYWAERKQPFFAIFLGASDLPELYRERQ